MHLFYHQGSCSLIPLVRKPWIPWSSPVNRQDQERKPVPLSAALICLISHGECLHTVSIWNRGTRPCHSRNNIRPYYSIRKPYGPSVCYIYIYKTWTSSYINYKIRRNFFPGLILDSKYRICILFHIVYTYSFAHSSTGFAFKPSLKTSFIYKAMWIWHVEKWKCKWINYIYLP